MSPTFPLCLIRGSGRGSGGSLAIALEGTGVAPWGRRDYRDAWF